MNKENFDENLVTVHMINETMNLDTPIYMRFSVLELTKELIYDFHNGFIKAKYRNNARLLYTDTDFLCYEIKTRDF